MTNTCPHCHKKFEGKPQKEFKLTIPLDMILIVPHKTKILQGKKVEIAEDNKLVTIINLPGSDVYHHVKKEWLEPVNYSDKMVFSQKSCERFNS